MYLDLDVILAELKAGDRLGSDVDLADRATCGPDDAAVWRITGLHPVDEGEWRGGLGTRVHTVTRRENRTDGGLISV